MPELPEVEVVRRGLAKHLIGQRFQAVSVLHPRPVRSYPAGPTAFQDWLAGRTVAGVRRRGKYLWLVLGDDALIIHLGMSGQFRFNQPDDERHPHTRVAFDLSGGQQLRFVDQRMFGGLEVVLDGAELPVPHIALDPFDENFDAGAVAGHIRTRRTTIKRALLDQRLISGIGNIYADEALWRAKFHYDHPTADLTANQAARVLGAAKAVMSEALAAGGTSFDSLYVNVNGESGYFSRSLSVYGKEGEACSRCGSLIERRSFTNRSAHYCPKCQQLPAVRPQ